MGIFEKFQAKLELYRLEQRYARRKNRATFTTGATYVDGEYVYPNSGSYEATVTSPTSTTFGSMGSRGGSSKTGGITATARALRAGSLRK